MLLVKLACLQAVAVLLLPAQADVRHVFRWNFTHRLRLSRYIAAGIRSASSSPEFALLASCGCGRSQSMMMMMKARGCCVSETNDTCVFQASSHLTWGGGV